MSRARWLAFGSTLAIAGCSGDATVTAMNQFDATAPKRTPRRHVESNNATPDLSSDATTLVIYPEVVDDGGVYREVTEERSVADIEPPDSGGGAGTQDAAPACLTSDTRIPFAPSSGTFPCGNVMCDRATQWCHASNGGIQWSSCMPLGTTCADSPNSDAGCGYDVFCWNANCDGGLRRCECVTTCTDYGGCSDDDAGGITVSCGSCYGAPPTRLERALCRPSVG